MLAKRSVAGVLMLVVVLGGASVAAAQKQPLVLQGGTLVDGTGREPIANAVVIMEGSQIKAVGTAGQVAIPPGARSLDLSGKTILPGLIDCHIHLRDWMPQMFLHYGVTTVYDTNNQVDWILAQKEALQRGKIKGPRLFVTGMAIAGPHDASNDTNYPVQTPQEAAAVVKSLVGQGADMIKTQDTLTRELLKGLVDEANQLGVPVVGHSENIRWATLAGFKFMEHTLTLTRAILEVQAPEKLKEMDEKKIAYPEYMMDTKYFDPLIQLMVQHGVYINPTFTANLRISNPLAKEWTTMAEQITKDPNLAFVPADAKESWIRRPGRAGDPAQLADGFKKVQEFTRKYVEAGGKAVAGSDSGYMPGLGVHFEMQSLVAAGVPPMKAIQSATLWAAQLGNQDKDLGTVEPGKLADITVIEGNPLQEITATRNVRLVIQNGEIIDTAYDSKFINPLPRPVNEQKGPDMGPDLSTVAPRAARQGSGAVRLELTGEKFTPKSVVRFDTTDLQTRFVSDSKLTAVIDSDSLKSVGTYGLTVVNPGSGGGTSNVVYFIVNFRY
jgi:imidazolonepropionase-like amidohydrolase